MQKLFVLNLLTKTLWLFFEYKNNPAIAYYPLMSHQWGYMEKGLGLKV